MDNFSTLIGGIAGDGINEAGITLSRLFSRLGYHIYMYYDYPSLIRGGHNFSLVRASRQKIAAHMDQIDVLIALNQETVEKHTRRLNDSSFVIYDADKVKIDGIKQKGCGLTITQILKEAAAPAVMKNSCIIGGYCKVVGIDWHVLEDVLKKHIPKMLELNMQVARQGYDQAALFCHMDIHADSSKDKQAQKPQPILTGNQAISLGLIKAGLGAYVAYPMTPSSSVLDFMARYARDFGIKVIHPESEIAVMLMAQGFAYAGIKAAVGTSGGGFCLMTEGLSLAGMAEMPVVVVMAQRTGPSTGLPTYTAQGDLHFVLNAGQGEFPRFIVAPGDAEEAYYWSGVAMNLAWKFQVPAFILTDKIVSESQYSFDIDLAGDLTRELKEQTPQSPLLWNGQGKYKRYRYTDTGVSPLAFPPQKGQAIKTDSYTHDEDGITSEDPQITRDTSDKRQRKGESLARDLERYETVKIFGDEKSKTALLCWGSNKGVCVEAARKLELRVIQVLVLSPFPEGKLKSALQGVERLLDVECNSTGQLARLAGFYGIKTQDRILKYDGRPFSVEDLLAELGRALA
ncbi:MAG: 2-oxoacid:acceptor oxidoreductase subunit alpha [Methanothrix sp.]|jgi:2-oxoglutarate ferredoxin oxidoreductase subunit alpha|nr:2-oxoacid:acceptor oxidoreductase subunit alpha [Methanothrix sp.]